MIRSIIFDVGNVLASFCWQEMFHGFGLEGEEFERLADATVRSEAWNEFDKGECSTEEIIDIFAKEVPQYRPYIERIFEDPTKMIAQFEYTKTWIQELKARGYQVYILSNWSKPTYDACLENELDFLPLTDGAVFSFQEHLIKPDKKIFECICQRYRIVPEEAVFLDDNEANIRSARAFGLHTIQFKDYVQGKAELEEVLSKQ